MFYFYVEAVPATLLKKRRRFFHVNFVKFLRTPFFRTPSVAASIFTPRKRLQGLHWYGMLA